MGQTAKEIIETLNMEPHPEGGWYTRTWRSTQTSDGRRIGSAIYYLLEEDQTSRWHRIDADEIWHFYTGSAVTLSVSNFGDGVEAQVLGPDVLRGERPQILVPSSSWHTATPINGWSLIGCTVVPAFQFGGMEIASDGWEPTTVEC